jgi:hypothetical protein
MIINNPDVIAEPRELYPNYEAALGSNDVEKLVEMFWADARDALRSDRKSLWI